MLYVPAGSVGNYQNADQWKEFMNIQAIAGTEVNDINIPFISIYPNPASDVLNIETAELGEEQSLTINDITGKQYRKQNITGKTSNIDISDLASGVYMLKIGNSVHKIIKR